MKKPRGSSEAQTQVPGLRVKHLTTEPPGTLCVKFEVTSFYTLEVMARTKIQSKNLERAIT